MSDILVVIVTFRGEGSLNLYFDQTTKAHEAYDSLKPADGRCVVEAQDDFGSRASVDCGEVRAVFLQNVQQHAKAAIEIQLANARASAALQKRQMSDPTLRFMGATPMPHGGLIA